MSLFRPAWNLLFKAMGWKILNPFPDIPKAVIAVGPHPSWQDILIGMGVRSITRMNNAHFLGKKELFDGPFGWFFRATGGVPVDRKHKLNLVEQVTEIFNSHEHFLLGIAPEGTRKKVDRLKTGFYHMARSAGVPIVMAAFDYEKKAVLFSDPLIPTGDETADMEKVYAFFRGIRGKDPSRDLRHL